jgi:enamine deaminase RidA (YjgF/YER057c/UK114 family)
MISNPIESHGQQTRTPRDRVTGSAPSRPVGASAEFILTECPRPAENAAEMFQRLARRLMGAEAQLLGLMIYGSVTARAEIERAMQAALGDTLWPVTWIEGSSCDAEVAAKASPLAGVQAFAIRQAPVKRIRLGGRVVGSVYEEGGAKFCLLGGLGPTALSLAAPAQVQQTFGNLEEALALAGFELGDVMRTWFYNDAITSWYREFNRVRSALYASVQWRTGSLPASTGIGARNPAGAALVLGALAMRPLEPARGRVALGARAQEIGSPLQCPAPAYGSAFSRAMEIETPALRRLLVSGTASIFPGGETAWVDNAKKQIDLTMEVVGAILESRGMRFSDVTRATAYFKAASFQPYFDAWLAQHGLETMPVVATQCDICRDDLLFEIEVDAAAVPDV